MIRYLPTIYPDELIYSWFCRTFVHSGAITNKSTLQELYCKRSDNPSKEFIGNLNPSARTLIDKLYSMDHLVSNHTMYPQYARFVPLEQKKTALYCLGHGTCDPHHLFSVLPRLKGEQHLRFCPLCVIDDREAYGETYWHRKHQIRNMGICTKHRCRLVESNVTAKSEQSFIFQPAESFVCNNKVMIENNTTTIQFATYLESVFDSPMDLSNDIPVSAILYHGMRKTKYLKPSGRSRYTKLLADDMIDFYKEIDLTNIASMYQIQRVLLGNRFDFSVVCQIAFFLGMEPEELTHSTLTIEQIQQEQNTHYMRDTIPVDWTQLDENTAPSLEKFAKGVYDGTANESGRPERLSEKLVYRAMGLLGHQLDNMPKCKAIFEQYTESYPENWSRKIIWAYQKLKQIGEPFSWTDIRKISGVKKEKLQKAITYLPKHTDTNTAEQIISLITEGDRYK